MTNQPNQPLGPPEADLGFAPPAAAAAEFVAPAAATRREHAAAVADAVPDVDSVVAAAPPATAAPESRGADPVVDLPEPGTFSRLVEPRNDARLTTEPGVWHQVSRKYVVEQLIVSGVLLLIVVAAMLVVALPLDQAWAWIPGGILSVIMIWSMAITSRQSRAIGYRLREDDLVFRRGILWQRIVAVPYGRMQLVDISHGPLDRGFGLAQLKLVTAAAATGVTIPGLPQATAEALRDQIVAVAESRRTGL